MQQREEVGCGDTPAVAEIDKAIRSLKNTKPGISGLSSQLFKALLAEEESATLLRRIVLDQTIGRRLGEGLFFPKR